MKSLAYGKPRRVRGRNDEIEIMFHRAGHVAGAVVIEITYKHRQIFFTGDVLFGNQRTLPGDPVPLRWRSARPEAGLGAGG